MGIRIVDQSCIQVNMHVYGIAFDVVGKKKLGEWVDDGSLI